MEYLFIINVPSSHYQYLGHVGLGKESAFIVTADSDDDAYRKVHATLRAKNPDIWSPDWQDFKRDVEDGFLPCYRFDKIERIT